MEKQPFILLLEGCESNCERSRNELAKYILKIGNAVLGKYRSNHSKDDLDDCIHDKIEHLLSGGIFKYKPDCHPDAWLTTVFRNCLNSMHRRMHGKKKRCFSLEAQQGDWKSDSESDGGLLKRERANWVHSAINSLPPLDKEIIYLFYFEEMDNDAIAGKLNITKNNLSVRKSRAIAKMKGKLPAH